MKSIARADIQFSPGLLWLFIAILTVWLWIWKLKQRSLKISFLWFFAGLIILLPASLSHVYSMGIVIEPYWFYFTEFGFFSFCAIALYELKNHIQRLSWVLFVGAISLYWGVSSYQIHLIARTEVSYLEHWLKVSPHNLLPAAGLASLYGYESKYPLPTKFQEHMQLQVERLVRAGHYIPAARLLERMQRDENLECVLYVTYLKSHEQNHAERLKSKLLENPSPSQYGKVVQYLLMLNEHHLAKQWIEEGLKRFPDNRLLIDSYDESKSQ